MSGRKKIIVGVLVLVVLAGVYAVQSYAPFVFAKTTLLQFDESEQVIEPVSWYSYSEEYLAQLRTEYELESMVEECVSDYEKVQVIASWVHGLWEHDGSNQPAQGDPIFILREVANGQRFRCVEYGVVISGCLQSLGMQARTLGLKTADVETRASGAGHVATEVFLRDLNKWVFIDGQWNVIPELNGIPLNAVELQSALARKEKGLEFPGLSQAEAIFYKKWISPYLYYFDVWPGNYRLMLGPVGAKQPTKFQIQYPLPVGEYTHSVQRFYAAPR